MPESARCIYRGCQFDPIVGEGDHVVPAALGEFANLLRFRGACPGCNNDIGKSEAQLLRCGPEAYMARIANPPQRRGREGKAWPGAMSAETIRQKIKELRIDGRVNVHFSVSADNGAWFDKIADELWPGAERTEFPMTEVGCYPGWGLVSFTVNDHYFRALAKMAFHYYLCYSGSGLRGDEPEFANLRRFIMEGGDAEPFLTTPRESPVYFGVPFGDVVGGGVLSSAQWCHLLAADDTQGTIVVYLQLFIGPGYANPPHYIKLGPAPAALRAPGAWAHMLSWEPGSTAKGTVEPKGIVLGGRPETIVGPWLDTSDGANALYTAYRTPGIVSDYRLRRA